MAEAAAAGADVPSHHGKVGVLGAAALVAGSMVGSGVYLLPATFGAVGSISILGWGAAMMAALAIAGMFAWLSKAAPEATGLGGYVQAGLGRFFGVQTAVAFWTLCWIGNVAVALAVVGAGAFLVPGLNEPGPRLATTLAAVWFAVGVSWVGPRAVARLEGFTLGIGLLPVVLVAIVGWFWFQPEVFLASWNPQGLAVGEAVGRSALTAFWAFLGLECAAAAAGVVRDPSRNVPRATLIGVVGVAALYIAATSVVMGIIPGARLAGSTAPFADAAQATLGLALGAAIAVCALLRAAGCLTGWTLVTAETTRSAADVGVFPAFFRTRPGERASPVNLLTAGVLMTLVAVLTATPTLGEQFGTLANMAVLLALYCYILAGASLTRLARGFENGRRVAAMATAGLAIACALALIAQAKPLELGLAVVPLAGAGLLYLWLRRR
ncbi:amino acid permease [Phenylobacterium sp.]|jgi:arginine:agmatine antiporter|uniref:amino acid permease n=1 Tax=Phenylobacterium sp. TaxID=1871053 RepID=UPI002ED778A4